MSDTTTTETAPPTLVQKIAAEALGTFVLVFFGCGSAAILSGGLSADDRLFSSFATHTSVGLAFGLAVVVMIYAVGRISGGHFNPAVTVGAALGGRLAWKEVGIYVGAQFGGAIAAGVALWVLLHGWEDFDSEGAMGQNFFGGESANAEYAWWAAFLLELITTAIFIYIILAVTDKRQPHEALAPLAIGLSLAMIHFATMAATGTSVNPARSVGVGLFAGGDAILQLWLFILAPLLGGALAGFTYPLIFGRDADPVPGSGLTLSKPAGQQGYQQQWQGGQQGQLQGGQWDQQGQQQWGQQGQQQWPQQGGEQQWQGQQGGQHAAQPEQQWPQQGGEQQWQQPEPPTQHQQQWGQQGYQPPEDDGRTQIRPDGQ